MFQERRARERHQVAAESALAATIQYRDTEPLPVAVRDLSRWGIGFSMHCDPRIGESVKFTLQHRGATIRFRATIKWADQTASDEWSAGCEFASELDVHFLTNLTNSNVLNPEADREASWVRAIVRSTVTPDQTHDAEIVNYSRTGVCLATHVAFGPGESLLLEVDDGHRPRTLFAANVMWERPEEGCVLQGCSFPEANEADKFYQAVRRQMERQLTDLEPTQTDTHDRLPAGVLAGLALTTGWCLLQLLTQ